MGNPNPQPLLSSPASASATIPMAMLQTQDTDRVYVSAANAKQAIRLPLGPGQGGPPRLVELTPTEAHKIAVFLLQTAERA